MREKSLQPLDKLRHIKKSPRKPQQYLLDMTIPKEYLELITPTLHKLGFTASAEKIEDITGVEHTFTLIANNGIKRFLLWIPSEILTNPAPEYSSAFIALSSLFVTVFGKEITLYIFHDESPHLMYRHIVESIWKRTLDIEGEFVELRSLEDFHDFKRELQEDYLSDLFKLARRSIK